ncbi:hypothetical protein IscW_ISCW002033, partial [Ixodes scapularis]
VLTSSPDDPLHALFVYVSGKRLGTKPAWQRAYKTILSRFQDVVALPEFLNLDMDHVSEILSGDAIAARSYISAKQVGQEGKFKQYTHPRRRFSLKGDSGSPPDQGMGDTSTVASSSPPSPMLRDRCAPLKCRSAPTGRRRTTMATARSAAPQPSTSGETSPPAMLEQERTSQVDAAQSGSEREIQLHVQEVRQQANGTRCESRPPLLSPRPGRQTRCSTVCSSLGPWGKHTRIEWDEYPAQALPEDSRLRHGSPGFLLVGGIDPEFPQQVSTVIFLACCTVLAYEEADDRWHRIAMLPEPRHHHAGAIAGDSVYVVGGLNSRRTVAGRVSPLASCLCYQLGQRQWDTLPDLHQSRAFHGCANVSGSIFAVGGKDKRGRLLDSVECLEPNASRWKVLGESLRPARMAMGVAAAGRLLCVAGGIAQLGGRLCVLADVDCYDVAAKRWLRGPRLPWPVCFGSLISAPGGSLIHVGGLSVSGVVHGPDLQEKTTSFRSRSDVVLWEPTSSGTCWRPLCPLPEPRHGVGAALCGKNGTLYVLGGLSSSTDRPPLGVLSAATSGDGTFYRASQLPGPVTGSLALPLPDTETTSSERR